MRIYSFLDKIGAILWKDLVCELRTKEVFLSMCSFALLVLVIFNFAFDLRVDTPDAVAPGALWIAFVFAGILGLGRTIAAERERTSLDRLLLCPVDRGTIYLGKLLGNILFLLVVEVIAVPVFAALFNLPLLVPSLIPVVLLGTLGFSAVGTLFSALAANTRAREVLLPLLLFPVIVPVVIACVRATGAVLNPATADHQPWLGLLAAFAVIFIVISYLAFEYVVEE